MDEVARLRAELAQATQEIQRLHQQEQAKQWEEMSDYEKQEAELNWYRSQAEEARNLSSWATYYQQEFGIDPEITHGAKDFQDLQRRVFEHTSGRQYGGSGGSRQRDGSINPLSGLSPEEKIKALSNPDTRARLFREAQRRR